MSTPPPHTQHTVLSGCVERWMPHLLAASRLFGRMEAPYLFTHGFQKDDLKRFNALMLSFYGRWGDPAVCNNYHNADPPSRDNTAATPYPACQFQTPPQPMFRELQAHHRHVCYDLAALNGELTTAGGMFPLENDPDNCEPWGKHMQEARRYIAGRLMANELRRRDPVDDLRDAPESRNLTDPDWLWTHLPPHQKWLVNASALPGLELQSLLLKVSKLCSLNDTLDRHFAWLKAFPREPNDVRVIDFCVRSSREGNCPICAEPFAATHEGIAEGREKSAMVTPCGHIFGANCLSVWMNAQGKDTCPMCRKDLRPEYYTVQRPFRGLYRVWLERRGEQGLAVDKMIDEIFLTEKREVYGRPLKLMLDRVEVFCQQANAMLGWVREQIDESLPGVVVAL